MGQQHTIGSHATTVATEEGFTRVTLHSTVVVKFNHKKIILDSGGWSTPTTKTRMNQASSQFDLGFHVFQQDFAWYVTFRGEEMPFENGMTLKRA